MTQVSQLAPYGIFDARVPRYTSYPTATQFSPAVGPRDFANWVRAIPAHSEISLYLHVPFCRRLCWFCACRTQGTTSLKPLAAYAASLHAEILMLRRHLAPGVRLKRLHWGGGTPTLMPAAMITDLAALLAEALPFAPGAEFSVEIDPNELDAERLSALSAAGLTRASVGVQDFDPLIQQTIGRLQSYEVTRDAVQAIRAEGIASLNTDILFGLPHQTAAGIARSVRQLLTLSPDRVALYGYAHVPWMARRQVMIPSAALPGSEDRLALFETARALFLGDGYEEIGIDHFARPEDGLAIAAHEGRLRRNFQGYTDDTAPVLIGLGASSISRFPQGFAQNAPSTSDHMAAIAAGHFSTRRGHAFTGDDLLRSRIIEALMCDFFVETRALLDQFDTSRTELDALFAPIARKYDGMVDWTENGLRISEAARPLTRMIARDLDAYAVSETGHSLAV